jgi:hypothetical protein
MIFTLACAALVYSGFCRLVHTNVRTRLEVRLAVYSLTVAALAGLYAGLFFGYDPGWPGTALAVAMVLMQAVTAPLWRDGVPLPFVDRSG